MRKTRTWHDNWNLVIRDILFPDDELKQLMCIPIERLRNIRDFVNRYFIEDAMPDELVLDEDVRIIYYETEGAQ